MYNILSGDSCSRIDKFCGDDGCQNLSHAPSDVLRNHKCHTRLGLFCNCEHQAVQ